MGFVSEQSGHEVLEDIQRGMDVVRRDVATHSPTGRVLEAVDAVLQGLLQHPAP